jgi:hypothetical protein
MVPYIISLLLCSLLALPRSLATTTSAEGDVITYQENDGTTIYLADDRRPALYTGDFGDCLGNSLIKVHRFDASYFKDNMTVTFDIQGSTNLTKEALMSTSFHFAEEEKLLTICSLDWRLCLWRVSIRIAL